MSKFKQISPKKKFSFDVMDLSKNPFHKEFKVDSDRHIEEILLPTAVKKMFNKK